MAGCGHGCVMAVAYARYSHADASAAQGPKVCRLFAGGKWIRNFGPWGRQVLRRNPNSFREIDKARRLGTVAILARNRKFESICLQRGVHCELAPNWYGRPRAPWREVDGRTLRPCYLDVAVAFASASYAAWATAVAARPGRSANRSAVAIGIAPPRSEVPCNGEAPCRPSASTTGIAASASGGRRGLRASAASSAGASSRRFRSA